MIKYKNIIKTLTVVASLATIFTSTLTAQAQVMSPELLPGFDATYYAESNPDLVAAIGDDSDTLLNHYIQYGKWEGRASSAAAAEATNTKTADYNVLFIGNSITMHPACQYWWGFWGMAASSPDKDYVHQVVAGLQQNYATVDYDIFSFSTWERDGVRSKVLPTMDTTLCNDYDLVVIQVGENVESLKNFESDYETLVQYVKNSVPGAQVVLVGDFWYRSGRDNIKKSVADRQQCTFIDLSANRLKSSYHSSIGAKVLGDDGSIHRINDYAVALHPNDKAMAEIAQGILAAVAN